jgi:fatty-acyl-CoA synthase
MSSFTRALATAATTATGMTTGEPRTPVRTSWADLHDAARRGSGVLADRGLEPGGAVAVLAGSPADVALAAQSAWLAGGSVTMLHQPTARTDLGRYATDTLTVLRVIGASVVVVGDPFTGVAGMLAGSPFRAVTVGELQAGTTELEPVDPDEGWTAFLQLTSGSTATPKAVRITHRNLWSNIESMCAGADLVSGRDVMVSWLPLFHDMGMVGFLTIPMCRGIELVKVTPADFLAAPLLWPELISRHGGTCTAAPNFAYALTARVLPRAKDLDLSSMRFALNGAEPIDVRAVRAFLAAGAPHGLSDTAVVPAYGMAEASLAVSFHQWGTPLEVDTLDAHALEAEHRAVTVNEAAAVVGGWEHPTTASVREFAVLGHPLAGIGVSVRDEAGRVLGNREVGVLHLRGEAITGQYLTVDGPEATQDADGWLDTGDLGYLTDGKVVVCGRVKDVIIMGGRNIYPTDIERAAETVAGVRAGNAAAVRLDAGERRETFAIVVESRSAGDADDAARIADEVRSVVTSTVGVRPSAVAVVPPGTLPKTPSGKLRRTAAARLVRKTDQDLPPATGDTG